MNVKCLKTIAKVAEETEAKDVIINGRDVKLYLGGGKTLNIVFNDDFGNAAVIGSFNDGKVATAEKILVENGIPIR